MIQWIIQYNTILIIKNVFYNLYTMNKGLLHSKKGQMARVGVDVGMAAIFILAIGLTITAEVIANVTGSGLVTGIAATVANYAPLIVIAGFIYFIARMFDIV
jgi:L-serine deaminase